MTMSQYRSCPGCLKCQSAGLTLSSGMFVLQHQDGKHQIFVYRCLDLNIARGTADPGIASITWIIFPATKLANSVAKKIQVKYFKIDFSGTWIGCITSKFGHQMAPLALVTNLVTRWRHLHKFQIWSPDGTAWISSEFGNQIAPLVLVPNLVTRWRQLH